MAGIQDFKWQVCKRVFSWDPGNFCPCSLRWRSRCAGNFSIISHKKYWFWYWILNVTPRTIWHQEWKRTILCQIILVSNCLFYTLGVKLSVLHCWYQIVCFTLLVSNCLPTWVVFNCPWCQIVSSPEGPLDFQFM